MTDLGAFGQHIGARAIGADDLAMGGKVEIDAGVAQALGAPAGQRQPDQVAAIVDHYQAGDATFWKFKQNLKDAREPLPADPRVKELKDALTKAEMPIILDPFLVQLRSDAGFSARQLENRRLTVVQDLAWALINNASFLFNH